MDRAVWRAFVSEDHIPRYPCPVCTQGRLKAKKVDVVITRAVRSSYKYDEDPDSDDLFTAKMACAELLCQEVVIAIGIVSHVFEIDHKGGMEKKEYLEPKFMVPAPPIIVLPDKLPEEVKKELALSFSLFWTDFRVCASRIRTSLERLMDHFGVVRYRVSKDLKNPAKRGKRRLLDLAARIDKLPHKLKTSDYSQTLHALRVVGNLGTHGKSLERDMILDAYELYEIALHKLFDESGKLAKEIVKRLKKAR